MFLPPRVVNTVPYGRLGAPNQRAGLVTEHGFKRLGCRAQPVVADGHTFYRCGGTWYDPVVVSGEPAYIEVWAPPGVTVEALPPEAAQVTSSGKTYYVAGGEFYEAQTTGPGYVLVQPAKGTRLDSLPGGLKGRIGVFSDGQTYYPYQGVFYREVVEGTQTFYEVADSPFLPPQQTVPAPAAYGSTNKPPS